MFIDFFMGTFRDGRLWAGQQGSAYSRFLLTIFLSVLALGAFGQVYPPERAALTATRLPLQVPERKEVAAYTYLIAAGNFDSIPPFRKSVVVSEKRSTNTAVVQLPLYDQEYTWQVVYKDARGKVLGESALGHFRVLSQQGKGANVRSRVRVLSNEYTDTGLCFFVDVTGALYNMKGEVLWHLPRTSEDFLPESAMNATKVTAAGTITFVMGNKGYEIDYAGKPLWITPAIANEGHEGLTYRYHHDFTRLSNGHYMVLSADTKDIKPPDEPGDRPARVMNGDLGTIIEFDASGNEVWRWRSAEYFTGNDLFRRMTITGAYNTTSHMNAFHVDEEKGFVYAGFRDLSRIVKIRYPGKQVVADYNDDGRDAAFLKQHSIGTTSDGLLCVFSNNNGRLVQIPMAERIAGEDMRDTIASVVLLREHEADSSYSKVWEFECAIDREAPAATTRGGNVQELADGSLFVCMGASPRIFIVNRAKKVLYNAVVEIWDPGSEQWTPYQQYRAYPVTRSQMDKLILKSVPGK